MKKTNYFGEKIINGNNGTGPSTYLWDGGLNSLKKLCAYADLCCQNYRWNGTSLLRFEHEAPFYLEKIIVDPSKDCKFAPYGLQGLMMQDKTAKNIVFFYGPDLAEHLRIKFPYKEKIEFSLKGRIAGKVILPKEMPAAMRYGHECPIIRY